MDVSKPLSISTKLPAVVKDSSSDPSLCLSVWVYYCMEAGNACMMKAASFTQPLQISATPGEEQVAVALTHAFWSCSHASHATESTFPTVLRQQISVWPHLSPSPVLFTVLEEANIDSFCYFWQKCNSYKPDFPREFNFKLLWETKCIGAAAFLNVTVIESNANSYNLGCTAEKTEASNIFI